MKKIAILIVLSTLMLTMASLSPTRKSANAIMADPWLEVRPNSYLTSTMETFNISVWLHDITADKRMTGFQFRLLYNNTLLEVVNVTEGPFLPSFNNTHPPPYTVFVWSDEPDGIRGPNVLVGDILLPDPGLGYTVFPEGSGLIATITFQGIHPEGNCALKLDDIKLTDPEGSLIPTSPPVDGYYEIWPLCGDVNHDRTVNIIDLVLVARAFGSRPGDSRWNPRYNSHPNQVIDIHDLALIALCFGQTIP